jgi:hypothetical protein
MAKDRNSMARRQRESDKQRRAQDKKERRDLRKLEPAGEDGAPFTARLELSPDEVDVLETFAKFLMPPDQMLCLSNADIPATRRALEKLIGRGLLTSNEFKGGYSLTVDGFNTMQQLRSERASGSK